MSSDATTADSGASLASASEDGLLLKAHDAQQDMFDAVSESNGPTSSATQPKAGAVAVCQLAVQHSQRLAPSPLGHLPDIILLPSNAGEEPQAAPQATELDAAPSKLDTMIEPVTSTAFGTRAAGSASDNSICTEVEATPGGVANRGAPPVAPLLSPISDMMLNLAEQMQAGAPTLQATHAASDEKAEGGGQQLRLEGGGQLPRLEGGGQEPRHE